VASGDVLYEKDGLSLGVCLSSDTTFSVLQLGGDSIVVGFENGLAGIVDGTSTDPFPATKFDGSKTYDLIIKEH
jgi:hypothetical protein